LPLLGRRNCTSKLQKSICAMESTQSIWIILKYASREHNTFPCRKKKV
jgi:hypothetical protein